VDHEQRKKEIVTNYFNTGKLKVKIDAICFKWYVTRNSKIAEDIEAEVWFALSNYNSEKLCKVFEQQGTIEGLAVQIAKYQFRIRKENPESPNNSFGTKLLHTSTFHNISNVSVTDDFDSSGDSTGITLFDGDVFEEFNYSPDMWEIIRERLTETENQFIEDFLAGVRFYKRKPTNEFKEFRDYVFNKIKEMDINKQLTPLEQIRTKLEMKEVKIFDVMFDEDLSFKEKQKKLRISEGQYISKRRFLLKKIKGLNIK
jgi:hypothetical protein